MTHDPYTRGYLDGIRFALGWMIGATIASCLSALLAWMATT